MEYRVTWIIDIDATGPIDAARQARAIQQDMRPDNIAHIYDVKARVSRSRTKRVDLDWLEGRRHDRRDT